MSCDFRFLGKAIKKKGRFMDLEPLFRVVLRFEDTSSRDNLEAKLRQCLVDFLGGSVGWKVSYNGLRVFLVFWVKGDKSGYVSCVAELKAAVYKAFDFFL
jgi:hypothetical protein